MYKNVNINSAATAAVIAGALVARVRVQDGHVQIRPTNRTNLSNLPKGEMLRKIGAKGSGSRIGLPSEIAEFLPEVGSKIALVDPKYGWYRIAAVDAGADNVAASISA